MGSEPKSCTYCGETDPYPRSVCMTALTKALGPSPAPFPCSESAEGEARFLARLDEADAGRLALAQAQRAASTEGECNG